MSTIMSEESGNIATEDKAAITEAPQTEAAAESAPIHTETSWLDAIPEDLKGEANLKDFKDVESLAKSYVNAQRMLGKSVRIPSEDASEEARQDFLAKVKDIPGILLEPNSDEARNELLAKLGRPEEPIGYKFDELIKDDLVDSVPGFEDEVDGFRELAHEIGLTNEQAQKLVEMRVNTLEANTQESVKHREESVEALKKIWGSDYDARLDMAKQVSKVYSEKYPDAMEELIHGPAGNNPAFLQMLAELGMTFKEKGHEGISKISTGLTPEEAKAKIVEKRSDRGFMQAYNDRKHVGHDKAIAELEYLYKLASTE